jgi:hypothetical protein
MEGINNMECPEDKRSKKIDIAIMIVLLIILFGHVYFIAGGGS